MIIRAQRKDHFTVINNIAIDDTRLGFRAKGVLIFILSKPDNWSVSERGLAQVGPDGREAVGAALRELETCGYLRRTKSRNPDGTWAWDSMIFDVPQPADGSGDGETHGAGVADFPPESSTVAGFSSHGLTVHGKPVHIIRTEQTNTNSLSPSRAALPEAEKPPEAARPPVVKGSPYMRGLLLTNGYVTEGTGKNAVQVYYERFHFTDPAAHLSAPVEDDLVRICTDLVRLREVVIAYSRTNYQPGNAQLILDWYHAGVPSRVTGATKGDFGNGNGNGANNRGNAGRRSSTDSRQPWANYSAPSWSDDEIAEFQAGLAGGPGHD